MCSIFGYQKISKKGVPDKNFMERSFTLMRHRGPDAENSIAYENGDLSLGHQRLSIIDIGQVSNQPMEDSLSSISFNGELYNYLELKKTLRGESTFKTNSDTEVLKTGLDKKGVKFLNEANGMFAFAYYNKVNDELILARDRFGVKPLHYVIEQGVLYFSSEIKPLIFVINNPAANYKIYDSFLVDTATDFNEETFIKNILQVKPGHYLQYKNGNIEEIKWYFENDFVFDEKIFKNKEKTLEFTENLLTDAISLRLRSDAPLCITLSGGLDSATIYTLIKEKLKLPITPFTFTHPRSKTDESELVKKLVEPYADKLILVESNHQTGIDDVVEALDFLEFPTWNPSAVAYLDMYKAIARQGFKVVLEGHGSDEQLGGYSYMVQSAVFESVKKFKLIRAWKIARILKETDNPALGQTRSLKKLIIPALKQILKKESSENNFKKSMDEAFYYKILPIVLRTFDRLSMACAIESRSPFMDYRVVEFFKKMPLAYKVSPLGSKAILREILKKYDKDFIYQNKHKMGFASDITKFFNVPATKKFFEGKINEFDMPKYKDKKERVLGLVKTKEWHDTGLIWKIAALSIINKKYGIQK